MHYKDGTKAVLGDIARGKGYNLPYPVQGVVVGLNPGQDQCGIHLAVPIACVPLGTERVALFPTLTEEHGTCSEFELVHPNVAHPLPRT
jgi:hypothetical protein